MPIRGDREKAKEELCRILNRIGAIRFGTFRLTSGRVSPYYIDLRLVPSFPDTFHAVCSLYQQLIEEDVGTENFDRVAGIPTAGLPFASVIAYKLRKPLLYVRKGVKLHGRERRVEGALTPGDRVLLIDDLITTGLSMRRAALAVRAEGGVVEDAVVLLDREEGGRRRLREEGITLHCLLRISEVAKKLYEMGAITREQREIILRQVER